MNNSVEYIYLGSKATPDWKDRKCVAVKNKYGKCVRGRNGNMLVEFDCGSRTVVIGRRLRKVTQTGD